MRQLRVGMYLWMPPIIFIPRVLPQLIVNSFEKTAPISTNHAGSEAMLSKASKTRHLLKNIASRRRYWLYGYSYNIPIEPFVK